MSNTLKPCPFCGGEAELYVTKHIPDGNDYTPRCKRKDCAGRLTKKYAYYQTKAIYAWNKRDGEKKDD